MTDCRKIVEMLTALRSFKKEEEEEEEADDEGFEDPGGSESRLKKDEEMEKEAMTSKPLERLEEFAFRYAFDTIETCYEGTQVSFGFAGILTIDPLTLLNHLNKAEYWA